MISINPDDYGHQSELDAAVLDLAHDALRDPGVRFELLGSDSHVVALLEQLQRLDLISTAQSEHIDRQAATIRSILPAAEVTVVGVPAPRPPAWSAWCSSWAEIGAQYAADEPRFAAALRPYLSLIEATEDGCTELERQLKECTSQLEIARGLAAAARTRVADLELMLRTERDRYEREVLVHHQTTSQLIASRAEAIKLTRQLLAAEQLRIAALMDAEDMRRAAIASSADAAQTRRTLTAMFDVSDVPDRDVVDVHGFDEPGPARTITTRSPSEQMASLMGGIR